MADSTSFKVDSDNPRTLQKLLGVSLPENSVVWDYHGYKIRAHLLTEGTISIVNTGAAVDTILIVNDDSLFTVARNALFSSTLQNENMEEQDIIGLMFSVDHTTTSPNTDAAPIAFDISLGHKSGAVRTYSAKETTSLKYKFSSYLVVEGAGIATLQYFGPLIFDFHKPLRIKRNEQTVEYFSATTTLWIRSSTDRNAYTAHTVVTTYTIKVNAYVILADPGLVAMFATLDDFWSRFQKEA